MMRREKQKGGGCQTSGDTDLSVLREGHEGREDCPFIISSKKVEFGLPSNEDQSEIRLSSARGNEKESWAGAKRGQGRGSR